MSWRARKKWNYVVPPNITIPPMDPKEKAKILERASRQGKIYKPPLIPKCILAILSPKLPEEAEADQCVAIPSLSQSPASSPTERKVSVESPSGEIDKESFLRFICNDSFGYKEFMEYTNRPEKFSMSDGVSTDNASDSGSSGIMLTPVHQPSSNNVDDSPDVPTIPLSSPFPFSHLPSTPCIPEYIVSQPPSPATFSPVPGPSKYTCNSDSPDSSIQASCRNVDTEGLRILRVFADRFKESRIRYEYSKQHVAQQISIQYNFELSEQQLQQFEDKVLSFQEMSAMKTYLEKWLMHMDTLRNQEINETDIEEPSQWMTSFNGIMRRKTADETEKQLLREFEIDPKPSEKALKAIAEKLEIRLVVVRVWFRKKRAKKKVGKDTRLKDDAEIEEELDSDDKSISYIH